MSSITFWTTLISLALGVFIFLMLGLAVQWLVNIPLAQYNLPDIHYTSVLAILGILLILKMLSKASD